MTRSSAQGARPRGRRLLGPRLCCALCSRGFRGLASRVGGGSQRSDRTSRPPKHAAKAVEDPAVRAEAPVGPGPGQRTLVNADARLLGGPAACTRTGGSRSGSVGVRRPHWQDPGDPAKETPGARVHESVSVRAPAAGLPAEGPPRPVPPPAQPQGALGIRPGLPARTRRPRPSLGLRAAVSPRPFPGPARGLAKRRAAG